MRARSGVAAVLAVVAFATLSSRASADESPSPSPSPSAEALFSEGRDLLLAKRYAEACPKLEASLKIDSGIGTMLWLADCYEKSGRTASAWATFNAASSAATTRKDDRAKVAARRADNLEARLVRIIIVVAAVSPSDNDAISVKRDGIPVSSASFLKPIPVDPGVHTISATAPGRDPWSVRLDLPALPNTVTVNVPILAATAVVATTPTSPERSVQPTTPTTSATTATAAFPWMRVSGVSLGVLGIVSTGAGIFFGVQAKSTYGSATDQGHCTLDNACDAEGKRIRADASSQATQSTIAVVAGAGMIASGVALYLLAPSSPTTPAISVTPTEASVSVAHRF